VLVNHGDRNEQTKLATTLPIHELKQLKVNGTHAIPRKHGAWTVNVPSYDGVVLQWNK
jgi:hypothetical protein